MFRRASNGFTIIELVIAVAISVLLVSVGVPRYNSFVQRQDFITANQKIITCLQTAQQDAAAPPNSGAPIRYTEAILTDQHDGTFTCDVASYNSKPEQVDLLYHDSSIDKLTLLSMQTNGVQHELNSPVRVVFGVLESGLPVQLYSGPTCIEKWVDPECKLNLQGFWFTLSTDSNDISGLTSQISMEKLGTPIQQTLQNP